MTKERQSYDREFKQKAVELSYAWGNPKEIAEELGSRPEFLYPGEESLNNMNPISLINHQL